MGYKVKMQKIQRPTNKTYTVSFPSAVAESVNIEKGEEFEWFVEDRNTFVLRRSTAVKSFVDNNVDMQGLR